MNTEKEYSSPELFMLKKDGKSDDVNHIFEFLSDLEHLCILCQQDPQSSNVFK